MNYLYIIGYIVSIPISFHLLLALTANYRSQINEHGNAIDIPCGIGDILHDKKYKRYVKLWGISSFIPYINIGCVLIFFIFQILHNEVGLGFLLGYIFKKLYRTSYLLNKVSEEI